MSDDRRGPDRTPVSVAGYSGTPLHRKLGVKTGHAVALIDAPAGWTIADLPDGVLIGSEAGWEADVTVAFVRTYAGLVERLPGLVESLAPESSLWIAWPRKAGGHVSDLSDGRVRDQLLPTGLVDTKVAALDDDWSGLKFVWRKELRAGLAGG